MAVTLTGTGGLFKRLGHIFGGAADLLALMGGTATSTVGSGASMQTRGTTLESDAAESPAVSQAIDNHWTKIANWQAQQSSFFTDMVALATAIAIKQVVLDTPLLSQDLTSALTELARQMKVSGDDLNASSISVGAQASLGSPTGTPAFVLSTYRADGMQYQTIFAETLRFSCLTDSYTGGATARKETFQVKGALAYPSVWDYRWPGGSNASQTIQLVDAQLDNQSGGNMLTNGDFETANTTNYFDNWVHGSGAAGTDFFAYGSGYTQSNALQIKGGGATNPTIYQEFNKTASTSAGAGGTPAVIRAKTQYAVCFWGKKTTATAGILRVALVDSSGTILNDDQGNAQSQSYTLSGGGGWTTSFVAKTAVFRTPTVLPTDGIVRLQFRLTTNLTDATESIVIDDVAMVAMTTQLYTGGPYVAGFAGATKVVAGDAYTMAITNTMGVMVSYLERAFSLAAKDIIFPYDTGGGETVADSLVA